MMVGEMLMPSFGALGIGGVIAFVVGSIMLMDTDAPGFGISWQLVGGVALAASASLLLLMTMLARSHRGPVITGQEEMLGSRATVIDWHGGAGRVRVHGEIWRARGPADLAAGSGGPGDRDRRPHPRGRGARLRELRNMPFVLNNAFWVIPRRCAAAAGLSALRILREYERAVVFQLGRFWKVKGPGLILVIPMIQQAVRVDLRIRVHDVPTQDIISRDNVLVKVNAVVYYRVIDPRNAIIQVEDFNLATSQLAQTTLRSVLGQHELDEMLAERERLNADLQRILDEQTESWGIKVSNVELKHVDIDESMIRVIARQAEAERVRRAKIIEAEGEQQAAQKILEAATILATRPEAMQLRYLGALMTIANERSSTIVFPFPTDLGQLLGGSRQRADGGE